MTLAEIVKGAEALYFDNDLSCVKKWRQDNGGSHAIGYLPIYFPRELIDAAGMLPVGMMGGRGQLEIIRGDAFFQSYICQIPRSTVELALSGRLDELAGFLFPSICDVIRNLSGMWQVMFPEKYVRYFDVPQNYDDEVGGRFYQAELASIRKDMAEIAQREVTDDDLRRSIERYNRNREAVESLMALRNRQPWTAPAHEAYLILYAGNVLPVDEHTSLVQAYVEAAISEGRPMRDNTRVVSVGSFCEQPSLELIKTLEVAGCYLVWDDMMLGKRWLKKPVSTDGDPISSLAHAFLHHSSSTAARYEPDAPKGAALRETVARTQAEGVVFAAPSFCDPALLEQPMLQNALDDANIPWTAFKYSENLGQFQVIREQLGTFADSIKLWSDR
jgi:benzoyl-CoA reductase subunit C